MADHFIEKCRACGTVLTQCRCPAPDKAVKLGECRKYPWCGHGVEMAPDLDQLRAEIEGLRRANELLGQDYRKLFAVKAALDADNERLKAEVAQTYATLEDAVSKVLGERKQLRELREAHDLLHKRIEAYDETHAYLQELREAAEELADVCRGVHAAYEDSSAADEHGVQFIGDPLVKLEKALAKGGA